MERDFSIQKEHIFQDEVTAGPSLKSLHQQPKMSTTRNEVPVQTAIVPDITSSEAPMQDMLVADQLESASASNESNSAIPEVQTPTVNEGGPNNDDPEGRRFVSLIKGLVTEAAELAKDSTNKNSPEDIIESPFAEAPDHNNITARPDLNTTSPYSRVVAEVQAMRAPDEALKAPILTPIPKMIGVNGLPLHRLGLKGLRTPGNHPPSHSPKRR